MSDLPLIAQEGALSPAQVSEQIRMIQAVMRANMTEGEHYGKIPGTGRDAKPTLLKSGAEKLCLLFRLAPEYQVETLELQGAHREVRVQCKLIQISTQRYFGSGVGSCSTLESKYRYRSDVVQTEEGKPMEVPGKYWQSRDPAILGGPDYRPTKKDGKWLVVKKVENPDLADVYNTVLKMAKKRAYIDATLSATAASDIFTQDLEDFGEAAPPPVSVEGLVSAAVQAKDERGAYALLKVRDLLLFSRQEEFFSELVALKDKQALFQLKPPEAGKKYYKIINFALAETEEPADAVPLS